jgi:hypothetical protein
VVRSFPMFTLGSCSRFFVCLNGQGLKERASYFDV